MDIWKWVRDRRKQLIRDGDKQLGELLYALPEHVVDLRHQQVDALVPEAVARARALNDPWLELFFRHWHMQSRVLTRMYGEHALGEAVALVDFAHTKETEGCPQSVCTVQDLAACYGIVDGPGWAKERIEVTSETLARIDPTWGCFDCISSEHADALRDDGQIEVAQRFLERQLAAKVAKDASDDIPRFCGMVRISVLSDLGRNDEALALVDAQLAKKDDAVGRTLLRRAHRARILARMGRFEEARAALPSWSEYVDAVDGYDLWSDVALLLVRAGAFTNDKALGHAIGTMVARLDKNGAVRTTIHVAQRHAELSLARGALWSARRALATMERAIPRLRAPLDALARVRSVREAIAKHESDSKHELPESPEALLDAIFAENREADAERDLPMLEAAHARWPAHEPLLRSYASALYAAGARDDAASVLEARIRAGGAPDEIVLQLGNMLIREDAARFDAFEQLVRETAQTDIMRAVPDFLRGVKAVEDARWDEAIARLRPMVRAQSDAYNTRRMLARALLRKGQDGAREALRLLDEVEAGGAFTRPDHWDRMVAATIVGEWAIARASADTLELGITEGEGPIDERWELCTLAIEDGDETHEFIAGRTGPSTARVLFVSDPGVESPYGDVWAFDARPLNKAPGEDVDEETRRRFRWTYAAVCRLARGGYRTVEIDGARPSDELLERFMDALAEHNVEVRTGAPNYVLEDPAEAGKKIDAVYLRLAVPSSIDDRALAALLERETAGWPRKMAWPALADAVGDEALIAEHRARSVAYGV
jgi:tetratricopeptide (TPR) repeat protein